MAALRAGPDDGVGGDGIGGWKIGAGGPDETPLYAPILADEIHANGATLAAADFPDALAEAEIAFRLRHDLPPRGDAYDLASVAAATEMLPALEIYRSRYRDPGAVTQPENLADCLANAGLVVGDPSAGSAPDPTPSWDIDLTIDGGIREGRGLRHPVGDPRRLVVWLANELAGRGGMLRAGQVVTTGALVLGPLGRDIRGGWRGIGAVSLRLR
jgi:2-keto-4-pentenoate hydratase